jgi:hypothetical protein
MAELQVQPKKRGAIWPWLLLAIGAIILVIFLARGVSDNNGPGRINDSASMRTAPSTSDTTHVSDTSAATR